MEYMYYCCCYHSAVCCFNDVVFSQVSIFFLAFINTCMLYSVHLKTHGGMVETSSMNNIIIKFGNYQLSLQILLPPLRGGYCKTQGLGIEMRKCHIGLWILVPYALFMHTTPLNSVCKIFMYPPTYPVSMYSLCLIEGCGH